MNLRGSLRSLARRWLGLSLTTRIVAGLLLGVVLGLFFGEHARVLEGIADAYIRLMQMTVLPFLVVALVTGLGRLDPAHATQLARYGGLVLLLIWGITLSVLALIPLCFPVLEGGSFFSSALLHSGSTAHLIELYIPANPFQSMSSSAVPAITLFSLSIGIALIGVRGKERFLGPLDVLLDALNRVTHFIIGLTPYGVIPVAAVAAGTLAPEQVGRLSVYFVTFILASIVIGLVVLPALVALLTPFRYREVVGGCRDALVTAFVTSNVFIVLPILTERCSELADRHGLDERSVRLVPAVVVPIAFNFPSAGKLLTLLFVPFAAWLNGNPLEPTDYPTLMMNGLLSYFAKAQVALPFLLDQFNIPSDLFNLYIPTSLINGKFDAAAGAMSLFAFTLITAAALSGAVTLRGTALVRSGLVGAVLLAGLLAGARFGMESLLGKGPSKAEALRAMHVSRPVPVRPPIEFENGALGAQPTVAAVRARGALRVCYEPERFPFSFKNSDGELVGYDVELARRLASDLSLELQLVPTPRAEMEKALFAGVADLCASVRYTHHWVARLRLTTPYMDSTLGLLVRDARRHEFDSRKSIAAHHERLRIGIPGVADLYEDYVREFLGDTPYELVELGSWEAVFSTREQIDAVIGLAEIGMAWSLVHPEYTVVIPRDPIIRRPLAFALSPAGEDLARIIDQWVLLERARGDTKSAYDYWILGKGSETHAPRWSIAHDVLGWID